MLCGVFTKQLTAAGVATICAELEDNFHAGCKHAEPSRTRTNVGLCAVLETASVRPRRSCG
jgi:hypothetical protein